MSRLRDLAEQATPGPWYWSDNGFIHYGGEGPNRVAEEVAPEDGRIIALAPEALVLLADAKDALAKHNCRREYGYQVPAVQIAEGVYQQVGEPHGPLPVEACPKCALLARIEELEGKA